MDDFQLSKFVVIFKSNFFIDAVIHLGHHLNICGCPSIHMCAQGEMGGLKDIIPAIFQPVWKNPTKQFFVFLPRKVFQLVSVLHINHRISTHHSVLLCISRMAKKREIYLLISNRELVLGRFLQNHSSLWKKFLNHGTLQQLEEYWKLAEFINFMRWSPERAAYIAEMNHRVWWTLEVLTGV